MESRSMISTAAGTIPAAMMPETASPAASVCAKATSAVCTASGRRTMRSVTSVTTPSVPSEPTTTPTRSYPGASRAGEAGPGAARHARDAPAPADAHPVAPLLGRRRQDDHRRRLAIARQPVRLVGAQLLRLGENAAFAHDGAHLGDDARRDA